VVIDLIEGEQAAANDSSSLTYTEAFDAMVELFRTEYAFTEYKAVDWDAMSDEFRPRFVGAEASNDPVAYQLALRDFTYAIPDGHVFASTEGLGELFATETDGGLGLAIREVDDGRIIASFVVPDGPAAAAGIEERAEILEVDGRPTGDVVTETVPWSSPFSTDHVGSSNCATRCDSPLTRPSMSRFRTQVEASQSPPRSLRSRRMRASRFPRSTLV